MGRRWAAFLVCVLTVRVLWRRGRAKMRKYSALPPPLGPNGAKVSRPAHSGVAAGGAALLRQRLQSPSMRFNGPRPLAPWL